MLTEKIEKLDHLTMFIQNSYLYNKMNYSCWTSQLTQIKKINQRKIGCSLIYVKELVLSDIIQSIVAILGSSIFRFFEVFTSSF